MELKNWLEAERGRAAALAAHLHVTPGRVSQMADDGVPMKYLLSVRDFTGGDVTVEEMVAVRQVSPVAPSAGQGEPTEATAG